MTPTDTTTRRWTATPTQRRIMVTALVVIPFLALGLVVALQDPTGHVVAAGEDVELTDAVHSGPTHEVRLPSSTVSIRVGAPTDEVDEDAADLPAPTDGDPDGPVRPDDGQTLLPVTWSLGTGPTIGPDESAFPGVPADEDETEVDVTLVAGDEEIELVEDRQVRSVVSDGRASSLLPVDEGVELSDVTVEVTYDGLTQVLSPGSGEIDSGAAAPLYEDEGAPSHEMSCTGGPCRLEADEPSTWRLSRDRGEFETGAVTMLPHHAELGWADEGRTWAVVDLTLSDPGSFYDEDDERRSIDGLPTIDGTLDGVEAEDVTRTRESLTSDVTLTFAVDSDETPQRLVLTQENTLEGKERPRTVTLREEIEIDDGR